MTESFTWRDGERTIRFGHGSVAGAADLLGDGYALLTTERAKAAAPGIVDGAATVHEVGGGLVGRLAAELEDEVPEEAELLVALGGGRVIDTAKALASGRGGRPRVAAIPTTLSAAEMTGVHMLREGAPDDSPRVRPAVVVNDPRLSASQPPDALAASAANSLAHAAEGAVTTLVSPVPRMAAAEAVRLTFAAYGFEGDGRFSREEPDREALALAAVLSGYTIGSAWYGLHHVLSQTLRVLGVGHGGANAAMLPHTLRALRRRVGDRLPGGDLEGLATELARRAGAQRLRDLGVAREDLGRCADGAASRRELHNTPPAPGRDEVLELYEQAW